MRARRLVIIKARPHDHDTYTKSSFLPVSVPDHTHTVLQCGCFRVARLVVVEVRTSFFTLLYHKNKSSHRVIESLCTQSSLSDVSVWASYPEKRCLLETNDCGLKRITALHQRPSGSVALSPYQSLSLSLSSSQSLTGSPDTISTYRLKLPGTVNRTPGHRPGIPTHLYRKLLRNCQSRPTKRHHCLNLHPLHVG